MNKSTFVLVPALLLTVITPAFATDGLRPTLRQERRDNRMEVRKEVKEARTTGVQERKDINLEIRRTRAQATLKRLRQGIVNRYENTLKQKASIEARIAKIESVTPTPARVRDLTAAKAKLATFSDVKYKSDLAAFDVKVAAVLSSDTPLKLTADVKASAKVLEADVKDLRKVLADTLRLVIKSR